ncbi:MAG: tetratricopeptide repeat protein, partial [Acidobacteriota bacterium]
FKAIGSTLFSLAMAVGADEEHPLRQIKQLMDRRDVEWSDRLQVLQQNVFSQIQVLVLLDNFEDNLSLPGDEKVDFKSPALAEVLESWLARPGQSRVLVTSRYPVPLRRLADHVLGPLSPTETRKLIWRLPGLDALEPAEQERAYVDVGGHPRALEYLDALLRGGEARFTDVAKHLEKVLREQKNVQDPGAWVRDRGADLDQALAATVTLATSDVLLERLLQGFADRPLAWPLLLGASVYRVPVERVALVWQVADELPDLPEEGADSFPGFDEPQAFESALQALERSGLVTSVGDDEAKQFAVHRWTANALARLASPEERKEAHRRAALYWRWRVFTISHDLGDLLEARHHHHRAGELDHALDSTWAACARLEPRGAYGFAAQLLKEALSWVPEGSPEAARCVGQLGNLAYFRGDYEEASRLHMQSLVIFRAHDDRPGLAIGYHQLGMIELSRGRKDLALSWFRKSLKTEESLNNRTGIATSFFYLGWIEQLNARLDDAWAWYQKSLAIQEELGDRAGAADVYRAIGTLEQVRGSYDQAASWLEPALKTFNELGQSAGIART